MDNARRRLTFMTLLKLSVYVAFYSMFLDVVSIYVNSILSMEELFLLGTRYLNTSIAAYTFFLVVILCLVLSLVSFVIHRIVPRLFGQASLIIHSFVFAVFSFVVLLGLRHRFSNDRQEFNRYMGSFLLLAFCTLVLIGIAYFLVKRFVRYKDGFGSKLAPVLLFGGFLVIILLPQIQLSYLKWRFNPEPDNRSVPNILFIVMDTTRADALSCYNREKDTTPNIDRIAEEGIQFTKAISAAPWTAPSHSSMFTGLYPSQHGTEWHYVHLDEEFFTLAECVSELGYRTAGFTENAFVSRKRGFGQGFQSYYEMYRYPRMAVPSRLMDRVRIILSDYKYTREYARDTAKYFKRWVLKNQGESASKSFFAFINFMPAHLPHYHRSEFEFVKPTKRDLSRIEPVNLIPERYHLPQYKLSESELKILRALYDGDVAYLDSVIGEIYSFLEESNLLDNTVLIITSDHGENFGDHGNFEHFFSLHNTLLNVPLVIRFPREFKAGTVNDDLVSTTFIYQTVLTLTGATDKRPEYPIETRSLIQTDGDGYVYAEHENALAMVKGVIEAEAPENFDFNRFDKYMKSIYTSDFKLIWSSNGHNELYDLQNDWQEEENRVFDNAETVLAYQEHLRAWLKALWRPSFVKKKKLEMKDEEAIKALGYIK